MTELEKPREGTPLHSIKRINEGLKADATKLAHSKKKKTGTEVENSGMRTEKILTQIIVPHELKCIKCSTFDYYITMYDFARHSEHLLQNLCL